MPPPPAVLFSITGRPMRSASVSASDGARKQPGARQQRHAVSLGDFARAVLQAELAHLCGCGADERNPRRLAGFGEIRIFAEKSVSRMNGFRARAPGGFQNPRAIEITLRGRRRSDPAPPRPPERRASNAGPLPNRPRPTFTPSRCRVRIIRHAMAPRLAIRTLEYTSVPDD